MAAIWSSTGENGKSMGADLFVCWKLGGALDEDLDVLIKMNKHGKHDGDTLTIMRDKVVRRAAATGELEWSLSGPSYDSKFGPADSTAPAPVQLGSAHVPTNIS